MGEALTAGYIFQGHHVAPWGVLSLCLLWLVMKRDEIRGSLHGKVSPFCVAAGAGMFVLSLFIPWQREFAVLKYLTACTGFFAAVFGRAAWLPARLLAVYAFTVVLPVGVQAWLERPYALAAAGPAFLAARSAGLPVTAGGQVLTVDTLSGESISVVVTAACAGPSTMAVFIAIFVLMMMDMRLPPRTAVVVFAFGAAGTWAQSVVRIVVILAFGHYGGAPALWTAHFWTIYVLFPLWYLIFAAVYFKVLSRTPRPAGWYTPRRA